MERSFVYVIDGMKLTFDQHHGSENEWRCIVLNPDVASMIAERLRTKGDPELIFSACTFLGVSYIAALAKDVRHNAKPKSPESISPSTKEPPYYYCVVDGGTKPPMVRHATLAEAEAEAERLAKVHFREVGILAPVKVCKAETTVKWADPAPLGDNATFPF